MFGQIPENGGYRSGGGGIFGQVPTNGGYTIGAAARRPSLGQFPMGTVYVAPPAYDDDGLLRIDASSLPAFAWSINSVTTDDPVYGASSDLDSEFDDTHLMEVATAPSGQGNNWMSTYVANGYVVMFRGKSVEEMGPTLSFIVTSDPAAVKHYASYAANEYMIVDGPEQIIAAAKGQAPATPEPSVPTLPGTTPSGLPHAPPCAAGEQEVYGMCWPLLPGQPAPSVPEPPSTPEPAPGGGTPTPGGTAPGTGPLPGGQANGDEQKAGSEAPGWVFPVLIGVAGLSIFVIMRASRKKGRRAV
jgi:hypothetical protein